MTTMPTPAPDSTRGLARIVTMTAPDSIMELKKTSKGVKVAYRLVTRPNPHPNSLDTMTDAEIDALVAETYERQQFAQAASNDPNFVPAFGEILFLGFDAEFQACSDDPMRPLEVHSYQFNAIGVGGQLSATYMPASGKLEDRLSLQEMLADLIQKALHDGIILSYPKTTVIAGFFLRVDCALLADFVDFRQQLGNVGGKLATTNTPVQMQLVCDRRDFERVEKDRQLLIRHGKQYTKLQICFYDIARHAPEKTPLDALSKLVGLRKRAIKKPFSISNMAEYRRMKFKDFLLYGMYDAEITILYYLYVLQFAKKQIGGPRIGKGLLPVSVGSLAVQLFKKKLKAADLDYETVFGVKMETLKPWDEQKRRYQHQRRKLKTTLRKVREVFAVMCYHGGRNECFYFGLTDVGDWFDLDLRGAYSIGLLIIRQIDYYGSYETRDLDAFKGDVMGFAEVTFEFPEAVRFPCLPVRTNKESLEFPRCGVSLCTSYELALALRLGAKISHVEYGVILPWKEGSPRIFEPFVREIRRLRAIHPKGSLDEQYAKLMGNSLYGKTGQGLHDKTAFDTTIMESKKIPESSISNGMIAALVTGFIRAVMGEILNGVPLHRKVISCTTDGILTDARLDELDLNGDLVRYYEEMLARVEND